MKQLILYDHDGGSTEYTATVLGFNLECPCIRIDKAPPLTDIDQVIFVVPNTGDEELPPNTESYLTSLKVTDKQYHFFELGNYFGLCDYKGCQVPAQRLLDRLNWKWLSTVAIDTMASISILEQLKGHVHACR